MKTLMQLSVALAAATLASPAAASDHREAPLIQEDSAADIADVYAFLNPNDSSRLVLAMTVNPFSVPSEAITFNFSTNVRYRFNIDTDGDAIPDSVIAVFFSDTDTGQQVTAVMPHGFKLQGPVTTPTEEPVSNAALVTTGPNGVRLFAGPRDDPFFFDVVGFNRFLAGTGGFTGTDGFAGFNVSAIAIEVPLSLIANGSNNLQIWGDTSRRQVTLRQSAAGQLAKEFGPFERIERQGNPAIATALIPSQLKDLYNIGLPVNDAAQFAGPIVASLQALGTDATNIGILASVAVPDTLKLDLTQPVGYPNGRDLDDDVIDTLFFFIFNQVAVSDGVQANDAPFLGVFPFLAEPFQAP